MGSYEITSEQTVRQHLNNDGFFAEHAEEIGDLIAGRHLYTGAPVSSAIFVLVDQDGTAVGIELKNALLQSDDSAEDYDDATDVPAGVVARQ